MRAAASRAQCKFARTRRHEYYCKQVGRPQRLGAAQLAQLDRAANCKWRRFNRCSAERDLRAQRSLIGNAAAECRAAAKNATLRAPPPPATDSFRGRRRRVCATWRARRVPLGREFDRSLGNVWPAFSWRRRRRRRETLEAVAKSAVALAKPPPLPPPNTNQILAFARQLCRIAQLPGASPPTARR